MPHWFSLSWRSSLFFTARAHYPQDFIGTPWGSVLAFLGGEGQDSLLPVPWGFYQAGGTLNELLHLSFLAPHRQREPKLKNRVRTSLWFRVLKGEDFSLDSTQCQGQNRQVCLLSSAAGGGFYSVPAYSSDAALGLKLGGGGLPEPTPCAQCQPLPPAPCLSGSHGSKGEAPPPLPCGDSSLPRFHTHTAVCKFKVIFSVFFFLIYFY